jgi:hypothetical protein
MIRSSGPTGPITPSTTGATIPTTTAGDAFPGAATVWRRPSTACRRPRISPDQVRPARRVGVDRRRASPEMAGVGRRRASPEMAGVDRRLRRGQVQPRFRRPPHIEPERRQRRPPGTEPPRRQRRPATAGQALREAPRDPPRPRSVRRPHDPSAAVAFRAAAVVSRAAVAVAVAGSPDHGNRRPGQRGSASVRVSGSGSETRPAWAARDARSAHALAPRLPPPAYPTRTRSPSRPRDPLAASRGPALRAARSFPTSHSYCAGFTFTRVNT